MSDRIDHRDPLPGYVEPDEGRWATPYITYVDGEPVHTCALRRHVHLTTREVLGGCRRNVFARTKEELQKAMDDQDRLSRDLQNRPAEWSERTSGPPSGGAAGSSIGP